MTQAFSELVQKDDAEGLRALLSANPDLRAEIDRPMFETAPAIVFCRGSRAMVDVLLEFGADINARSQFWGRTIGVLDDNGDEMRAYLIERGALPEITQFVEAVQAKDVGRVRALLEGTPALRRFIDRPFFPFGAQAIVAASRDREMVEALLAFGADINVRSDWRPGGFGVLDGADQEQAAWLISQGAIVDIHAAAALGKIEKVREWLAKDPSLVHARGGDGQMPLHFASTIAIIDLLLESGADIDARDIDHTATAAQYKVRQRDLCRHLIARGGEVDIFMAAALSDIALVDRVLESDPGAIAAQIGHSGYAPVPPGHIYQWLLDKGPTVLRVAMNYGGQAVYDHLYSRSPVKEQFLQACLCANEQVASGLLGAHPTLMGELTPGDQQQLNEAVCANNLPVVKLMVKLGFDINNRGGEGFTPVCNAALWGHAEMTGLLIAEGADLEIRHNYGGAALQTCKWGSLNFRNPKGDYAACAEALLEAGAVPGDPDYGSEPVQAVLERYAGR